MIAKIIMFLGDILFNMRVVIDEITMFLANLGAFTPYLAFKSFFLGLEVLLFLDLKVVYYFLEKQYFHLIVQNSCELVQLDHQNSSPHYTYFISFH